MSKPILRNEWKVYAPGGHIVVRDDKFIIDEKNCDNYGGERWIGYTDTEVKFLYGLHYIHAISTINTAHPEHTGTQFYITNLESLREYIWGTSKTYGRNYLITLGKRIVDGVFDKQEKEDDK